MAGTVTITPQPRVSKYGKETQVYSIAWTSDASGDASASFENIHGYVIKAITDPVDGPTASYDITLIDEHGCDALAGKLADRHTTTTEQVYPVSTGAVVPIFLAGDFTFTVANAGNAKSGICVFYILESL